jgi:hypothetical protein
MRVPPRGENYAQVLSCYLKFVHYNMHKKIADSIAPFKEGCLQIFDQKAAAINISREHKLKGKAQYS